MKIKIDKADKLFSRYIRLRDKRCVRCGKLGEGEEGINGLQNSHFFGRGMESTRFDVENCDAVCFGCHQYWGSKDREAYREYKIQTLGRAKYNELVKRARQLVKKNREESAISAQKLLESLEG